MMEMQTVKKNQREVESDQTRHTLVGVWGAVLGK